MTTARPTNDPIVDARTSRPRPSSASRASCDSRSAARRSSSARRLTRNPMTLRSRPTGSTRPRRSTVSPSSTAAAARASSASEPPSPSISRTAGTRARARAAASSWVWDPPGATTARAGAGMMARSPDSRASNAGTRALRTRTQATSRSARSGSRAPGGPPTDRAVGKSAPWRSRNVAIVVAVRDPSQAARRAAAQAGQAGQAAAAAAMFGQAAAMFRLGTDSR